MMGHGTVVPGDATEHGMVVPSGSTGRGGQDLTRTGRAGDAVDPQVGGSQGRHGPGAGRGKTSGLFVSWRRWGARGDGRGWVHPGPAVPGPGTGLHGNSITRRRDAGVCEVEGAELCRQQSTKVLCPVPAALLPNLRDP